MSSDCIVVLIRHGESALTAEGRFAGWTDVPLSERGIKEAEEAAELIANEGIQFQSVHTSVLKRTKLTAETVLRRCGQTDIPKYRSWRLNERHYGQLEGKNKIETSLAFGKEQVRAWRRSWNSRPPPVDRSDPRWPGNSPLYRHPPEPEAGAVYEPWPGLEALPTSEAPQDCLLRVKPYLDKFLRPRMANGETTLIVAHGTPLRCLCKLFEDLSDEQMIDREIPSGVPIIYTLDRAGLKMVTKRVLIDEKEMQQRMAAVANQADPDAHPGGAHRLESLSTAGG